MIARLYPLLHLYIFTQYLQYTKRVAISRCACTLMSIFLISSVETYNATGQVQYCHPHSSRCFDSDPWKDLERSFFRLQAR